MPGELQHGVLHDIERIVIVTQCDTRNPEGSPLYACEKAIEGTSVIQRPLLFASLTLARKAKGDWICKPTKELHVLDLTDEE